MKYIKFKEAGNKIKTGIYINDSEIVGIEGDMYGEHDQTGSIFRRDEIKILPPCNPSKIICVGLNYRDHAVEMKKQPPEEPMLFMKPNTTVIAHGEEIVYPSHMSKRVDYEGELAVVIGRETYMVGEDEAEDCIFGYTCINDVTARDLQAKDIQFTRGKGFNTFAPLGPFIETEISPANLHIKTLLNDEVKQDSNTGNLIFGVEKLVSFVSRIMTLFPGDVIATGTPAGVSPMQPGDRVEVHIDGVGSLVNYVV